MNLNNNFTNFLFQNNIPLFEISDRFEESDIVEKVQKKIEKNEEKFIVTYSAKENLFNRSHYTYFRIFKDSYIRFYPEHEFTEDYIYKDYNKKHFFSNTIDHENIDKVKHLISIKRHYDTDTIERINILNNINDVYEANRYHFNYRHVSSCLLIKNDFFLNTTNKAKSIENLEKDIKETQNNEIVNRHFRLKSMISKFKYEADHLIVYFDKCLYKNMIVDYTGNIQKIIFNNQSKKQLNLKDLTSEHIDLSCFSNIVSHIQSNLDMYHLSTDKHYNIAKTEKYFNQQKQFIHFLINHKSTITELQNKGIELFKYNQLITENTTNPEKENDIARIINHVYGPLKGYSKERSDFNMFLQFIKKPLPQKELFELVSKLNEIEACTQKLYTECKPYILEKVKKPKKTIAKS